VTIPNEDVDGGAAPPVEYRATGASLVAVLLAIACFGAVMLLHIMRGDIDPLRQVMSEYANGSHGRVMTTVFYTFGLAALALAFRLRRAIDHRWPTVLMPVLLAAAGVGLIASGVFEVERPLVPDTLEEVIHSYASVAAFVLLITAMFLLALACRKDARWWSFRWAAAALAVAAAVLAAATPTSAGTGWSGAVQRLLSLAVLLWFLLTALHVRGKAFRPT